VGVVARVRARMPLAMIASLSRNGSCRCSRLACGMLCVLKQYLLTQCKSCSGFLELSKDRLMVLLENNDLKVL
jgi:hypothetical protein